MPEPVAIDSCELKLVDPERVRAVQASLPEADVVGELADVFGLLSDRNRLRLLASLLEGGGTEREEGGHLRGRAD